MTQSPNPPPPPDGSTPADPQAGPAPDSAAGGASAAGGTPAEPAPQKGKYSSEERTWAMFTHLAAFSGFVGVPLGQILGPLVVWLIKREEFPFVNEQGKESLNFQITMIIAALICIPLMFVCVGVFLLIAVGIVDVVFTIIAAIKANEGVSYRYPMTIRMIK